MIPPTTRRGTTGVKLSGSGTRDGLIVAYGLAALSVMVLGAVSHPTLAAGLLAVVAGAYAILRRSVRILRRRTRWTVRLPGTRVRLSVRVG